MLHIESLNNGWCDKDIVLLHACFQLLKDCVEKEQLLTSHIDWAADVQTREAKKEIEELYSWWKERKDEKENDLNKQQHKKDTQMLIKLINIRKYLWT